LVDVELACFQHLWLGKKLYAWGEHAVDAALDLAVVDLLKAKFVPSKLSRSEQLVES